MSWKLAELRWRHEVGLFESRWEKGSANLPVERKRAIEAFDENRRCSRSQSTSRQCAQLDRHGARSIGLGEVFQPASPAPKSSYGADALLPSSPPPGRDRICSLSSLVPLLETTNNASTQVQISHTSPTGNLLVQRQGVTRCQSCSALSISSSQHPSLASGQAVQVESEASNQVSIFGDQRDPIDYPDLIEVDQLIHHQDSGFSSDLTDQVTRPSPSGFSQVLLDVERDFQRQREPVEPEIVDVLDHCLEFEGTIFELLNDHNSGNLVDIGSPQDSSETRWASTLSKHHSNSFLIPFNVMSDHFDARDDAHVLNGRTCSEDGETRPRTPKRRMTPIYDDYQTAVSMIRSGTPQSRSSSAVRAAAPALNDDVPEMPQTYANTQRRRSYSMVDVSRKLAETYNEVQASDIGRQRALKTSDKTDVPVEEKGSSIPVFPLRARASDEGNERAVGRDVARFDEGEDNPAGLKLNNDDIPLQDMELSQVRSRTRGDPVSSQEIHASSADFGYIDDSEVEMLKPMTYTPTRASGATDTSTIGKIVDQYASIKDEKVEKQAHVVATDQSKDSSSASWNGNEQAKAAKIHQARTRPVVDAGPPPSWPLPTPPPTLPLRSSKRRNSSGVLSSSAAYGNTSELLNSSHFGQYVGSQHFSATASNNFTMAGLVNPKLSRSSRDLGSGVGANWDSSGAEGDHGGNRIRLSHVSEESSALSSTGSAWVGLGDENENPNPGLENPFAAEDDSDQTGDDRDPFQSSWAPGHRRTENVPRGPFTATTKQHSGVEFGAGLHFPSVDQVLAGADTDGDTIGSAEDNDWETVHSRSQSNVQLAKDEKLVLADLEVLPNHDVSTFISYRAPTSTWDPLSTNQVWVDRSERHLQEVLWTHKEFLKMKQDKEVGRESANDTNAPISITSQSRPKRAEGLKRAEEVVQPNSSLPPTTKPQSVDTLRYRHPVPLTTPHKDPFKEERPALPKLIKTESTSSTDTMYHQPNDHIKSTSSVPSRVERRSPVTPQEVLDEIVIYDPDRPRARRVYRDARLTRDRRDRRPSVDPELVRVQRRLAWWFRILAVAFYAVGGFLLLNDMANGGKEYAEDAILQTSRALGWPVVGFLHQEDVTLAQKLEKRIFGVLVLVGCGVVAVLAWALATIW